MNGMNSLRAFVIKKLNQSSAVFIENIIRLNVLRTFLLATEDLQGFKDNKVYQRKL